MHNLFKCLRVIMVIMLLWPAMAAAQTGPVRVGIYQYHDNRPEWELPNPPVIQAAYEAAYGANNVTMSFIKAQDPWVTPTDLPNIDVLWISRYNGLTATAAEQQLLARFIKSGKHVVFSSVETHSVVMNNILNEVTGKTIAVNSTFSSGTPFPSPTDLFGMATGLNALSNTSSYENYNGIPACNRVAASSLFFVPSTRVRGGSMFVSGEIQAFSKLQDRPDWTTLINRIAALHKTYMYETQADLIAKDTTGFLASPCAEDVVVEPLLGINNPTNGSSTNDTTPTIDGVATPLAPISIEIKDANGQVVQTLMAVTNPNGQWTVDANALAEGTYTVEATSGQDSAGPITFTVDTTAPTLTVDTPNGPTNDDTPTVSGTTEANANVVAEIVDANGAVVQTLNATADAMGNWTVDAAQLPEGNYTVNALATDAAGNTSAPATTTFEIDTTAPTLTLDVPADQTLTNDDTPTVGGTSEPLASINVTISDANGTVQTLMTSTDAQGNWTVDAMQLPDGDYTIEATATDAAGNTSTPAGPVAVTIDTTAPSVAITAPAQNTITNDDTPDVTGTVEAGATLEVTFSDANGQVVQTVTTSINNTDWSGTATSLADGTYTVTATATDAAGNSDSATSSITIDTMPPALAINAPADGAITNDDTPTISGTTEPGLGVGVLISDANGIVQTLMVVADAMGNWTVDATQLPEGSYTVVASTTDAAGNNTTTMPVGFTIDTTAPVVEITTPAENAVLDSNMVAVTGTAEANAAITVELIDANGQVIDTQMTTADAQGAWSSNVTAMMDGAYTIKATAQDQAGNQAADEHAVTIDAREPVITITTPADGDVSTEVKPTITGTTDADATVVVVIKDAQDNIVQTLTPTVDANGNWTVDAEQDLTDGEYTIEATATRPNNKMATATSAVTIDTTAPDTTITTPAMGMVGNMNQPEISGTSEAGATVDVTVTNAAGTVVFTGQVTADDQGNWSVTPDSPLADDAYTVEAKSTDAAGNEGAPAMSTFTVDTNAPMVMITSPANGDTVEDTTPTVTGTAEPGATVTIFVDGMEAGQATADAQGNWSFDVTDELAQGDHTIEAKSTDEAGNEGTSGELTVTIAEPKDPVTITAPTEGEEVTGPDVTVTGTGEPGEEVTVTVGGNEQTATVGQDGTWTTTFNDVLEGEQTITAQQGDGERVVIKVNVNNAPEAAKFYVTGGCSSTPATPVMPWMLVVMLMLLGVRRRR